MDLQNEHAEWVSHYFPGQTPLDPCCSMVEEAGELLHACLKLDQAERFGMERRYDRKKLEENLVDAIGDCAISYCSYCNASGWKYQVPSLNTITDPLDGCVQLVQVACSLYGCGTKSLGTEYMRILGGIAQFLGLDFSVCIERTWGKLKLRRRDAPPKPKVVCLCGSTRFKTQFIETNFKETMAGNVVLSVGADARDLTSEEKAAVDQLHMRKIEMSDEIVLVAPVCDICDGCGRPSDGSECCGARSRRRGRYWGESTINELAHARKLGRLVRYSDGESYAGVD